MDSKSQLFRKIFDEIINFAVTKTNIVRFLMKKKRIIGRIKETERLHKIDQSGRPEFVAVYGRRRVGKTFLIDQLYGDRLCFSLSGAYKEPKRIQLQNFTMELNFRTGKKHCACKNWTEAFGELQLYLDDCRKPGERQIVFIDELPWLDTPKSGFVRALDYFWNHHASKHSEIMLITCGSATSWMVNNLINDKGGLHNRVTREIHLHPFTLNEVEAYLDNSGFKWNRHIIVQVYMILGGIPYYLDLLDKDESFPANIDNLMFAEDGQLANEYHRLYASLFGRNETYTSVIALLSKNGKGLTRDEICEKLKIGSGKRISTVLNDLVNCDFLSYRVTHNSRQKKNGGIYQLVDFFTLFHYNFIEENRGDEHFWSHSFCSPIVTSWQGLAFERVCMSHISQIKAALHIDSIRTQTYSWRSREKNHTAQIDMVIERADMMTHICEMKFSQMPFVLSKSEYEKLGNRLSAFQIATKTNHGLLITLITPQMPTNSKYNSIIDKVLTLDALFG